MRRALAAAACIVAAAGGARSLAAPAKAPTPDPAAVAIVRRYVEALRQPDPRTAYAQLTQAQQRYFGNARNFASNYAATGYRVLSFAIAAVTYRNPDLVQVDVDQHVSYDDIASGATATAALVEPYFALRSGDRWGVKELVQPWKSYAPHVSGRNGGLVAIVERVAFFSGHVQIYCTLRNLGAKPIQVLPLLKSRLVMIPDGAVAALDEASFPPNDRQFFEGVRIYPAHQAVGYVVFPLPKRVDGDVTMTLTVRPAIEDGASAPMEVTVGPLRLSKY